MSTPLEQQARAKWYALDLTTTADAREAVEYALIEAGALGTETLDADNTGRLRVSAYFGDVPDRERVRAELAEALRIYQLPSSSVHEMNVRAVADEDWLGEWKKSWQPVEIGKRFIVAPPWAEIDDEHGRLVIRIEPGMAFGTGTHETTRLCLQAIERTFSGASFLDVGTGTGILAIAAAKLVPDAIVNACDTDVAAIEIARENARLNDAGQITFRAGSIEDLTASADVVCANLTADVIVPLLPALLSVTCGRLILSGILETQADVITASLRAHGVSNPCQILQDGEWIAIIV